MLSEQAPISFQACLSIIQLAHLKPLGRTKHGKGIRRMANNDGHLQIMSGSGPNHKQQPKLVSSRMFKLG
ncbi:hypothetical protein HanXRQr2_Chr17g0825131 [Helianthus annuus]|uniref:Uncharacterized protein n=1 Tax=Helianthus annuus TaxID=4232 RepID=A0A251RU87_HELAN|nr:hypothetical protein HanXRQr2_Chr17g0825131 [Helianthus annuus]KAJ0814984.1 hypothetical protein HanPSC8_Chr17g0792121 [Helianthus annuus]